jgi:hypothetical protein
LGKPKQEREAVRLMALNDEFLSRESGWTYDQSSKGQTIELA